jgi:hypothetical protein
MNRDEAVRRLTEVVRRQHLALATERTYCAWLRRYCDFLKGLPLHLPSEHKLERFLTVLAQKHVAASTQSQAFNAINSEMPPHRRTGVLDCRSFNLIRAEFSFKRGTTRCRAPRGRVWRHGLPSVSLVADRPQAWQRALALA